MKETTNPYHKFLIDDHFADNRVNHRLLQLKHLCQSIKTERIINAAVGEQISPQTFLLDLLLNHITDIFRIVEQVPHLKH